MKKILFLSLLILWGLTASLLLGSAQEIIENPKNSNRKQFPFMSQKKPSLQGKMKVNFVRELIIGTNDFSNQNHYSSLISDFKIDQKNRIYVLDGKAFDVKIFSSEGKFISSFKLNRGQGPADFNRPKCMAVDKDSNIYIGDMNLKKISIFNSKGKFIKTIKTREQPAELEVDNEKNIYLTGFFDYSEKKIHKYSTQQKEKLSSFSSSNEMTKEVALFGESDSIFVDNENNIYFSYLLYFQQYFEAKII